MNGVPQQAVMVRTGEEQIVFGTFLTEPAKRFFAAYIMDAAARS